MSEFVHLHTHTDYSLLDGASSIANLVKRASELGSPGFAITDHGNLFGVARFYKECKAQGVNPIIGSEFYTVGSGRRGEKTGTEVGGKYYHLILLARDEQGYRNLMRLSSLSYTEGFYYKPRIDDEALYAHAKGLICCSACIAGEIPSLVLAGRQADAERRIVEYRDVFGPGGFYLELQDHGMEEERRANRALVEMGRRLGVPLVASNDIHYARREDAFAHDILLCVGTNRKKNDANRMRFPGPEFYMKSAEEMASLFAELPEALANTMVINEMCSFAFPKPGPLLPEFVVSLDDGDRGDLAQARHRRVEETLAGFDDQTICKPHPDFKKKPLEGLAPLQRAKIAERLAMPVTEHFIQSAYRGLFKRYPEPSEQACQRLDFELSMIILMDFVGYFLIVADFINWAKDHDIPVGPGRGSGAGSLVAYSLRITDIDPLRYNLLFERFLNPERVSMPDFDVDFCFERRQEVIDYVTQRYGSERVGQIITFGTLKAKAVIKDVARALDIPFDEANQIAKLVPDDPKITLEKAFEQEPKLKALSEDQRYRELFEVAHKLEGKNRHTSYHAAGIVIGRGPLNDYVPVFKDPHEETIATQFTMDLLEDAGLVKMDFLGLKTLTLIKNTIDLLARRGVKVEPEAIPLDDKKTYDMLSEGKATSVFQFESSGMQGTLKQAKPNRLEDLIALNALYRPGPMAYIPRFIDCKLSRKPIVYDHPSLEPILKETYGVIVYQEQVMQVAQRIAGYSLGQADMLRRAMSKKKADVLAAERLPFAEGAERQGISKEKANAIYDMLVPFAEYGFNKSHAAAYSVVAYQTAYLKANYPAEFMAANLTNEIANQDKLQEYIIETRKMGIEISPPSINRSDRHFVVEGNSIVYGLLGIKGLGSQAVDEITRARAQGGPFASFLDFLDRVDARAVNRKAVEVLVQTGCFDSLGQNRACLMLNMEAAQDYSQRKKEAHLYGQSSLFDDRPEEEFPALELQGSEEYPREEILRLEKELLGFYFSGHPMDAYRQLWERCADLNLAKLAEARGDRPYLVIGQIKGRKEIITKKSGKKMAFAHLDDFVGGIELVFFPETYEKCYAALVDDAVVALRGKLDLSRSEPAFIVEDVPDMEALSQRSFREVHIRLSQGSIGDEEDINELKELIFENGGACQVYFHFDGDNGKVVKAAHQIGIQANDAVLERLRLTKCVAEVWKE